MLEFKKEYFQTEVGRWFYPVELDLSKCVVYGCKPREAFLYKIPNDYYKSNAGNIDFNLYPNGVWSDYTAIKIIELKPYFQPSVNFNKLGDITPSNLNKLKEEIKKHIVDLENAVTKSVLFIDSGNPGQNNLPYLPDGCVWVRNGTTGNIEVLPFDETKKAFQEMLEKLYEELKTKLNQEYNQLLKSLEIFLKQSLEKITSIEEKIITKISEKEKLSLNSIKDESDRKKQEIITTGERIKSELELILEQAGVANLKTLFGDYFVGIYNPNEEYYPGNIYFKEESVIINFEIPSTQSLKFTVKDFKIEPIKKFFRIYNDKEIECNLMDNSDHKVLGFSLGKENKFIRINSTIEFELNTINYIFAFNIPDTSATTFVKEVLMENNVSKTEIVKKQFDNPLYTNETQTDTKLRKFNY